VRWRGGVKAGQIEGNPFIDRARHIVTQVTQESAMFGLEMICTRWKLLRIRAMEIPRIPPQRHAACRRTSAVPRR
jgi:hypothetical protein